ncbi:MAG: hypothetical protein L3J74_16600 [Bacteroidales bacterium]|jgi:hypothetical protein|nr:hypothetical protein [Bacteroidales bacterium]
MESTSLILSIVSIANMGILGIIIAIFGRMFSKTRAQLPLGMIVVAGMLFLHNVIGGIAYFSMEMIFSNEIFPYMLGVGIAEFAGLIIFLKITLD